MRSQNLNDRKRFKTERTYARALLKIDFDFEFDLAREEDVKVTAVTPVPFPAFP